MGIAFHVGPEIVSTTGKQEGARLEEKKTEKNYVNATRSGPLVRKGKKVTFASTGEPDLQKGKAKAQAETRTTDQERLLPNEELTPKRVDTASNDPVKDSIKGEPHYRNRAPVELGLDVVKIVEAVLETELYIPLKNLAGVSTAIQKEIKRQMTKTKVPTENGAKPSLVQESNERQRILVEDLPLESYVELGESEELPEGYRVAQDPILQYLTMNETAKPEDFVVSRSSEPLRAIYMTINGVRQEECLLDNGSMIVSMSKAAAVENGLNWDPEMSINMESASNHLEPTLGLAKNVKFAIGGLQFFLQVHILKAPPYRVLLGRPFDRLTRSVVKNAGDGSSELSLQDPNSGFTRVIPTYRRGEPPENLKPEGKDFQEASSKS